MERPKIKPPARTRTPTLGLLLLAIAAPLLSAEGPETKLALYIELPLTSIYVPVTNDGEIIAVLPVASGKAAGIRFIPQRSGAVVKVEVAALPENESAVLFAKANFSSIKNWRGESLGTYSGKEGDSLAVPASEKFDLPPIAIRVVQARASPLSGGDARFCEVNHIVAAPNPGVCMRMAQQGMCCRAGGGTRALLLLRGRAPNDH